ncbi:hypothetical protein FQR65_LT14881 [Abscondita terminalis]|nr:hypothetical protein FQR65_LT14881 [Abscondita terminalis]
MRLVGFVLFFFLPYIEGELHLIVSEFRDNEEKQLTNSTVEVTAGTDYYLTCMVGGYGIFSQPHLRWSRKTKNLKFRTEKDLTRLAENGTKLLDVPDIYSYGYYVSEYSSNKVIRKFEPIELSDRGTHFCMSLPLMLFKIVHVKVKDIPKSVSQECGTNQFQCVKTKYCINLHYKCDGLDDCNDRSDEDHVTCNGNPCRDKIRCRDGRCIPRSWCCDKHTDDNCNVKIRPSCCPPLQNPYDPWIWYSKNVTLLETGKSGGSKIALACGRGQWRTTDSVMVILTACARTNLAFLPTNPTVMPCLLMEVIAGVVSALLSFVLFLFVISKICGFDSKPRNSTSCSSNCEHSECVLRRQFSADVSCLYQRDNVINNNAENNNEMADPLIVITGRVTDQPPSYSEVINTKINLDELVNAPPPPYSSTNFATGVGVNENCDNTV